jgi:hypothetical protein
MWAGIGQVRVGQHRNAPLRGRPRCGWSLSRPPPCSHVATGQTALLPRIARRRIRGSPGTAAEAAERAVPFDLTPRGRPPLLRHEALAASATGQQASRVWERAVAATTCVAAGVYLAARGWCFGGERRASPCRGPRRRRSLQRATGWLRRTVVRNPKHLRLLARDRRGVGRENLRLQVRVRELEAARVRYPHDGQARPNPGRGDYVVRSEAKWRLIQVGSGMDIYIAPQHVPVAKIEKALDLTAAVP